MPELTRLPEPITIIAWPHPFTSEKIIRKISYGQRIVAVAGVLVLAMAAPLYRGGDSGLSCLGGVGAFFGT